ncbi:MAG: PAS domain-containing protein [Pseudomonadota bacterium]
MTHPDIREMGRSNMRDRHRQDYLELLTSGAPLAAVLESVAKAVESELAGSKCSILLLDEAGERLLHGAAPSLPDFYNQAIHGIKIGQGVGSCGTAAFTRRMVIVEDIMTHPYWADFQELAQKAEVGSCWSDPILAANGAVLGAFAIYHQEPRKPSKEDIEQLRSATKFVRLAIEHHRALDNLKKSQQRLALVMLGANDGIWDWNIAADRTYLSDRCLELLGYQPGESIPPGAILADNVHPDERPLAQRTLQRHLKARAPYDVEHRIRTKDGKYRWFRSRGQAVWNEKGRATRMAGSITDITERRQAERDEPPRFPRRLF